MDDEKVDVLGDIMKDLSIYCITPSYTIKEALAQIEENKNRAVLVVDDLGRVSGLLSQGDIIRALASGANLFASVGQFSSPSFMYLKSRDLEKAYQLAKTRGMTIFPVLDDDFKLIDVLTLFDVFDYVEEKMRGGEDD